MTQRPTWDEYFTQLAQVTSTRSSCERLQVGCVLVRDNRVISQGYNGYMAGCPHI
jgi:dCMP deaminase